jgi:serine phosphatase RsbU (regulator of sigma subunit)
MADLIVVEGPQAGKCFVLEGDALVIGRDGQAHIHLPGNSVSRQHARLLYLDGTYWIEDLRSRNGTLLRGQPVRDRAALASGDRLRLGEFVLEFTDATTTTVAPDQLVVREEVEARRSNQVLFAHDPARQLQIVLEIAQELGTVLDLPTLLDRLLGHLLQLFPRADRGMVILCHGDRLDVRAQRSRRRGDNDFAFSRTILRQALEKGAGLLSAGVADAGVGVSQTVEALAARSLLCVPLLAKSGSRLGAIQLDQSRQGAPFQTEDLRLLTTLSIQVAVALENLGLQADRLREEALRKELALAREIQQGFLPTDFATLADRRYDLFARVDPASEVAGDYYDYFPTADGRLAFFVGDVSGKGMPAALFLVAVRTLGRHLAARAGEPSETLAALNDSLAADNAASMFVTLAHGLYDPADGQVVLASGGHPAPLLRRADGSVEDWPVQSSRVLGCIAGNFATANNRLRLAPGETLVCYTDGFTEAFASDGKTMFGAGRLRSALAGPPGLEALVAGADAARKAVRDFTGGTELQDDQTLLLLRRRS